MGRQGPIVVVTASLLAAGVILGGLLVDKPGVVIPMALESFLLISVTVALIRRERDPQQRGWLMRVVAVAVALRTSAMFLVYGVLSPAFFAADAATYWARGKAIADYWAGIAPRPELLGSWQSMYERMNAWAHVILGDPTWFLVVLNAFAGIWTILLSYFIARRCFGVAAAKFTAVLVTVFPSMVLWSILNIRDSITTMLVTFLVLLGVRAYGRIRAADLVMFGAGMIVLSTFRDYMSVLVLAGMALGLVAAARPGRVGSTLAIGVTIGLVAIFTLERSGLFSPALLADPFSQVHTMRSNLQQDFTGGLAGSAYGVGVQVSTAGQALRYLPLGLAYFLFAPFPWAITSMLQIATLPEVLLWYALTPFLVLGLLAARRTVSSVSLMLVGVLMLTVCSYALVEGNFGTAYRHRAQIMPLFFVFCGQGLATWWRSRTDKERRERQRRAAAKRQLILPETRQ